MKETVGLLGAFHGEHGGTQLGHTFCYFFTFCSCSFPFYGGLGHILPLFPGRVGHVGATVCLVADVRDVRGWWETQ